MAGRDVIGETAGKPVEETQTPLQALSEHSARLFHDDPAWSWRVQDLLRAGFGVEDIALALRCDVRFVRAEVQILREQGRLVEVLR